MSRTEKNGEGLSAEIQTATKPNARIGKAARLMRDTLYSNL